jgi:hypothetical protein
MRVLAATEPDRSNLLSLGTLACKLFVADVWARSRTTANRFGSLAKWIGAVHDVETVA